MIIIAGALFVAAKDRDRYLAGDRSVVEHARSVPGCHDFALSPDAVYPCRINVFERWEDDEALRRFRAGELGGATGRSAQPPIVRAAVRKYRVGADEAP